MLIHTLCVFQFSTLRSVHTFYTIAYITGDRFTSDIVVDCQPQLPTSATLTPLPYPLGRLFLC